MDTNNKQSKMAQEALLRAHDELEMRVKERTAQLTSSNLELRSQIDERKKAEEALKAERDNLVRIFVAMADGVYIVDQKNEIQYINPALEKDFGPKEGRKCYEYFHDRNDVCPWCKNEEVFAGKTVRWEWYSSKNGRIYDLIDTPLINPDGTIYKLEIFHDITERKRVEEALRESEQRNRHAQKISGLGYWEWNIVTGELYWSDLVYSQYGLDSKTFQPSFDVVFGMIHPEDRDRLLKAVQATLNDDAEYNVVARVMRPDDKVCYIHTLAEVTRDAGGKPIRLVGTQLDITQRKQAEEEKIALVTREQAALAEAEAARKLDRMKSMFIASTSHELRTPLNSIIGFTSLILDGISGELNPEQKEQLEIVHTSGKHLLALINDIIDLSQMEDGRKNVEVSEFKLGEVVEEAFSIFNIILKEKKLELKVDVGDIFMKSDRRRLLQCLMNLISNAIKYIEKGSVEITAKVKDNNVEISVIDTGIGIKTEDIPKLFGPFVRLQSPLTLKTSGTGLGLYLVKKLATDFLGGDVDVKSEYGKGSTFILHVPVELEGSRKAIYSRHGFH